MLRPLRRDQVEAAFNADALETLIGAAWRNMQRPGAGLAARRLHDAFLDARMEGRASVSLGPVEQGALLVAIATAPLDFDRVVLSEAAIALELA
jgi:hypothetical protein